MGDADFLNDSVCTRMDLIGTRWEMLTSFVPSYFHWRSFRFTMHSFVRKPIAQRIHTILGDVKDFPDR